jgi:hypothetical protein
MADNNDTADKLMAGVVVTGDKIIAGIRELMKIWESGIVTKSPAPVLTTPAIT